MPNPQHIVQESTRTGNRVLVSAQGRGTELLGFGAGGNVTRLQNVTTSIATGAHEISEMGNPDPVEVVHGLHRYQVSIDTLTLVNDSAIGVVNAEPVEIEIVDRYSNAIIHDFINCTLADERLTIPKHTEIARGLTFIAAAIGYNT